MRPDVLKNYRPLGPGQMACRACGKRISTNALARAAHDRHCKGRAEDCKRCGEPIGYSYLSKVTHARECKGRPQEGGDRD